MGNTPLAPASLVAAFRRAKDVYLSGGEITIVHCALLRIYFKRVIQKEPKQAAVLGPGVDQIICRNDITEWLGQARALGLSVFGENGDHG